MDVEIQIWEFDCRGVRDDWQGSWRRSQGC